MNEVRAKMLITKAAENTGRDEVSIKDKVMLFEKGMGIIINLALQHVEVLQIIDMEAVIQHLSTVLGYGDARGNLWDEKEV